MTALACGMIAVGSCNGDVTSTILQTIMEKSEQELKDTFARWLPLGLGLNHLGESCQIMDADFSLTNDSIWGQANLLILFFSLYRER